MQCHTFSLSTAPQVEILAKSLKKSEEEIAKDINRPRYFDAQSAKHYGIIDKVS